MFIFLFQSFPLGDKSSVNLRGEFHTENVTTYDEITKPNPEDDEDTTMTEGNEDSSATEGKADGTAQGGSQKTNDETKVPKVIVSGDKKEQPKENVDLDALYPLFWSLQSYFSAPSKMFDADRFASFKAGLAATLSAFKNINTEMENQAASRSSEEARKSHKRKRTEDEEAVGTSFNPKYLTSRDLFDLEISDTAFRRHVLVQALILLDFMLSLTPKAKTRLADCTNKSVLYGFVLNETDAKWALDTRKSIEEYLQKGVSGKFYYRMVDTVLSRDKNWARWKAEGCPPIERPAVSASDYASARDNAAKTYANKRLRAAPMGTLDLNFLSDLEALANVERLKESDRYSVPSVDSFRMAMMDDDMDLDMAQDQKAKEEAERSKASKVWRILRLSAKTKLSAFDKIEDGKNLDALFQTNAPPEPTENTQPAEETENTENMETTENAENTENTENTAEAAPEAPTETATETAQG